MLLMFGWCKHLTQETNTKNSAMLTITAHGSITDARCHFPEAVLQNIENIQRILPTGTSSPSFLGCLRTKICISLLLGNLLSWRLLLLLSRGLLCPHMNSKVLLCCHLCISGTRKIHPVPHKTS